ncbi:diaminohydroxyphosphoribosylaminopyrimidine deaminase / 5-amino-6-(5-phosphoribosylamino)uracil reductase [Stappia sp. ES.058]|nr:diaminohydroxyphosphoribosylaminopyrimidine deaminase / 5-amino-6-(5-phosphoribosylamino)uracil reductase [Stappia sp. ES.058]
MERGAHAHMTDVDARFMSAVLAYARRGLGRVWPNPSVGALIVSDPASGGVVVGQGVTQPPGGAHAEVIALRQAGERARGATCYVTLEPCSHQGRTGPCAVALADAGIARVVIGLPDPNPRVSGRGVEMLRARGVEVVTGVLRDACAQHHAGHVRRVLSGRPHVILKLAVSRDGFIGREGEGQIPITGPDVFRRVHVLRAECDGILVGVGTAIADDPVLNCRLSGLANRSPVRVVLDTSARLPLDSRLVATAREVPVWVLVSAQADPEAVSALSTAGCTVIRLATPLNGRIEPHAAMRALGQRGLTRLLVEGGATVANALLGTDLADEVIISRGDMLVGEGGILPFAGRGLEALSASGRYAMLETVPVGTDTMTRYLRRMD